MVLSLAHKHMGVSAPGHRGFLWHTIGDSNANMEHMAHLSRLPDVTNMGHMAHLSRLPDVTNWGISKKGTCWGNGRVRAPH